MNSDIRMAQVIEQIDAANRNDPNSVQHQGSAVPSEYLYSLRMTARLQAFEPQASALLQIAVRAQHIQRWKIPRRDYPEGRTGYKRWRSELAKFHADTTAAIMAAAGYDDGAIEIVKGLLQKKRLKLDPQVQTLEDVVCLVFIEHYLADFSGKHSEEKLLDIIAKTWHKMSARGHDAALQLPLADHLKTLLGKALARAH